MVKMDNYFVQNIERNKNRVLYNENEIKHCPSCNLNLPKIEVNWAKDLKLSDGLYLYCKPCCYLKKKKIRNNRDSKLSLIYGDSCLCCGNKEQLSFDHLNGRKVITDQNGKIIERPSNAILTEYNINRTEWYMYVTSASLRNILLHDSNDNIIHSDIIVLCSSCNSSKSSGNRCFIHNHNFVNAELPITPEKVEKVQQTLW